MKRNLKETLVIAEIATDPKVKLQARAIANTCYQLIMEMSTNAGIVSDALKFVTQSQQKIGTLQNPEEKSSLQQQASEEEKSTDEVY